MVWSCPSNCTQCTLLDWVPPLPQALEQALQAATCHTFCMQGAVAAGRLVTAEEQLVAVVAVPALLRQVPAGSSTQAVATAVVFVRSSGASRQGLAHF